MIQRMYAGLHQFQSTPPARGATTAFGERRGRSGISIHAPREGGDQECVRQHDLRTYHFNPRPPRGGRHNTTHCVVCQEDFNPRPPRGGRRGYPGCHGMDRPISIHAPREGGDRYTPQSTAYLQDFNPRPPRGGRPPWGWSPCRTTGFQSTPPARGATTAFGERRGRSGISIHAPREGGDQERRSV